MSANETPKFEGQNSESAARVARPGAAVEKGSWSSDKAHYIMIGGFLGAGKTTSVARLAQRLTDRGLKVGLITNDQGSELVDTAMLRSRGFATEEIPGGCFCCRFNSLVDAAQRLTEATRPDVFIAEPVGSCTDLIATVSYPLRRIYGDRFSIAPLSVLVDPVRALRVFGVETGGKFSEKVIYIYRKQLEEADLIVVNKIDVLEGARLFELESVLRREFGQAEILRVSARAALGLEGWFERILDAEQSARMAMPIDYDIYADGEASLGWLNATIHLSSPTSIDANELLKTLARKIQRRLQLENSEIAHLKMTFSPDAGLKEIAVVSLVRSDFVPELSQVLEESAPRGQLIVNLRAEAAPAILKTALRDGLASVLHASHGMVAQIEHVEHFQPGRPQPTHRLATVA